MKEFENERNRMIRYQLDSRGIVDVELLAAFERVERHLFVPAEYRTQAYADEPLPIECGQTISQPYVVAKMTELLGLSKRDRVLEIGTGSGYQTAILAELAGEVWTLELIEELHLRARETLDRLGYGNIHALQGNGFSGYPPEAPYDAIIVTAAPPEIPENLVSQLAPGGRMVIPVGSGAQMLMRLTREADGSLLAENIFPVIFVPMKKGGAS